MAKHKSTEILIFKLLIVLIILLIGVISFAFFKSNQSSDWITHTWNVKNDIRKLGSRLRDAETGQRGYLLTQSLSYLEPYTQSRQNYRVNHAELLQLVSDNQNQIARLMTIDSLSVLKFNELDETINLFRKGKKEEALAIVNSNRGKQYMDSLRVKFDELESEENILLEKRLETFSFWKSTVLTIMVILSISSIVCIYLLLHRVRPLIQKLVYSKSALEDSNLILSETLETSKSLNKKLEMALYENHDLIASLKIKNKQLDHFAYVASHDLQEPLRTVSNYIDVFQEDYAVKLGEDAHQYFKFINDATERMRKLIKGLLQYSRIGRSGNKELVNLNSIIDDIKKDFAKIISDRDVIIHSQEMPEVYGLSIELKQLFQNLISNAIKFTNKESNPHIKISCIEEDSELKFSIVDNGIGMKPKRVHKIFDMFSRLHSSKDYEGQGIGLAFCKKIVDLHGGEIWATSVYGISTSVYFTLKKR